jgi:hypothetical protein
MKTLKIILSIFILLSCVYSGAWFYMAHIINQKLTQFHYGDAPQMGINFYSEIPRVSGFPFEPKIIYRDGFKRDEIFIYFDELVIKGFPIPTRPISVSAPNDFRIKSLDGSINIALDYVDLEFIAPKSLPQSGYEFHIKQWQEEVGKIDVIRYNFASKNLIVNSKGSVGLDDNLQLDVFLNTKTFDYESFINFLVSIGTIQPFVGALSLSGMNSIAQKDKISGEKFVDLDFKIKDQQMSFGPIDITKISPIRWRN